MVKRKFDKNQTKLGIKTLDWNVPKDHISRFVVDFIEDVFPILEIDEPKKKKRREPLPLDSMSMIFLGSFVTILDHLNVQFKGIEENTVVISKYYCK